MQGTHLPRCVRFKVHFAKTLLGTPVLNSLLHATLKPSTIHHTTTWTNVMIQSAAATSQQAWHRAAPIIFTSATVFLSGHIVFKYGFAIKPTLGISMVPTIAAAGDWVLISRSYRRGRHVVVGDMVSFAHPVKVEQSAIKRVIGMPGDFVLRDTPGKGAGVMLRVCLESGYRIAHAFRKL